MACCNSIPTLGVQQITLAEDSATLMLTGVLPVSGRFNVKVNGNCLDKCSALPIILQDATGAQITIIIDRNCGNKVLLNKVAVQACRHKLLHFCRSSDNNEMVVLRDKICAPTPIVTAAAGGAAGASGSSASGNSASSGSSSTSTPSSTSATAQPAPASEGQGDNG